MSRPQLTPPLPTDQDADDDLPPARVDPVDANRPRQAGLRDAAFQAAAQGAGENYLSAFALLLHAAPLHIGILSALPQLIGMVAQLSSVRLLHVLRVPRRLLQLGGWGQAACWIPLILLPLWLPEWGPWIVVGCAMLYFAFGHTATPIWNSLLIDVVEADGRGAYFAHRARITALVSFATLGTAGAVLTLTGRWDMSGLGFALIFLVAAAARLAATRYQAAIAETVPAHRIEAPKGFRHFLARTATKDFRWFLLFSGAMHFAVLISGPFFVVYLLRDLHWSYLQYAGWMAASLCGQFVTLTAWGQLADRYGNKLLLTLTALTVPLLPMGYLLSEAFVFLSVWNFFGGVIWAGLSLGLQNYVFDSLRPEERTRGVALANAMNAIGWGLGALAGSRLATLLPTQLTIGWWDLTPASNLPFVFCLSGLLRLVIAVGFLHSFGEPRATDRPTHRQWLWELPLVKPLASLWPWRHIA